jgi:two-component system cell cycle sensor histidine kinase/response regulator CckA
MTSKDRRLDQNAELRQQVEEMLRKQGAPASPVGEVQGATEQPLSPEDILVVLHDLRVHQIELDMQNEELRRTQAALGAERERYLNLYDQAPVGYCTIGDQELILEANLSVATLLGVARDALVKQPISRFILKEDQDIYYLFRKQPFAAGKPQECELRMTTVDGTTFWAHLQATVAQAEDGAPECRIVITDITARKQAEQQRASLEEQLRGSQKMEAIGSLAGGVAHDFNNLLTVILSYTDFSIKALRDEDPLKHDLLEVKKAADRAAALTRQLLAFSRKQVLQPVALSLNQSVAGLDKMLQRILGEDINLVRRLAPEIGLTLADPGQIEQVLMNLVVNARDAMPEGGKLTIETSNVEIDEEYAARHLAVKPGSYVQLAVTDTGCGMDEQTQARIFEPFFTTKEIGKGTGLGLSTVFGIVKQSGGNIWVYSELGRGTTFKVYLPRDLSATTATTIKPPTVPRSSRGTETILVVEDEEALLRVALRALGTAGYIVLTAANGREALLQSAQHAGDIHLLLTDVVMPHMSGTVLAQELSKKRPTVKVVYMSGYTDDSIVHHGVLDAGTRFLAKPFTSTDLAQKVREVLDEGKRDGEPQAAGGMDA